MREILGSLPKRLQLLLCAVLFTFSAIAQGVTGTKIKLSTSRLTRGQVIEQIEKQTAFKVGFVKNNFDEQTQISLGRTELTLNELLDKLTEGSGNTYTVDKQYILLYRTSEVPSQVIVKANRTLTGIVLDRPDGTPQADVTVELVDLEDVQTQTYGNGRFRLENLPAGTYIARLTSADGATVRWREITLSSGKDTDVTLWMGSEMIQSGNEATPEVSLASSDASKTTAYFVPVSSDATTIHAFSDEPKTEYNFVPSTAMQHGYLPQAAVKTNLLVWGTATPNVAVEFGLARKWTLDVSAGYNPFALKKGGINKVGFIQPEVRYWFCQRFEKHFVGLHGLYGRFNVGDLDLLTTTFEKHRYKGWGAGAGLSYGYHLPMSKRWAWEFTVGIGYVYLEYDKYRCYDCDQHIAKKNRHYLGPTKAGISLIYMIK